jgi:HPt (histidine-containing phosphotransfer) domain-containing protein
MEKPNINYIKEMSGGDTEFEEKIISILKKEFPEEKEIYFNRLEENDLKKISDIVHKIKHKISILGLTNSYNVAVGYEKSLLDGSMEGKDNFEAILNNMTEFLDNL